MIVEGLAVAAFAKACYGANKSLELDEKALKKYAKAFERSEEAELLVKKKAEFTDMRLANVAKKKRAIVQTTVPRFVKVYSEIQKIELENKSTVDEIVLKKNMEKLAVLNAISLSVKKEFTDKELVCGFITKGLGKLMVMDSERYLSAANNQMRQSNVVYSQAESIVEIYDAIVGRADRIAKLLASMNALFNKCISETEHVIKKNGLDVRNYSEFDKSVLMTCVNMAGALADIIDIPVVDENGVLCEQAVELIEIGENYIDRINKIM